MKILILTGKFGMGHYSAAMSLKQQLLEYDAKLEIQIEDIFDYTVPKCSKRIYQAFHVMVKRGKGIYNCFYRITENGRKDRKPIFAKYFLEKLNQLLLERKPVAIISTLPFCSQLVSQYKRKYQNAIPLITCITDVSSHSEWINADTDCYLVASKLMKLRLILKGVEEQRILVNGIPVKTEFYQKKKKQKKQKKQILIMGGGYGMLPMSMKFYQELDQLDNVEITVITGKNRRLYHQLQGKFEHIQILGYCTEVYTYMQQADLVISKPGGITLFETIYAETPLLVFRPFLQQEINNSNFILAHKIGKILEKDPNDSLQEIKRMIQDETELQQMEYHIKRLKEEYDQSAIPKIMEWLIENKKEECA